MQYYWDKNTVRADLGRRIFLLRTLSVPFSLVFTPVFVFAMSFVKGTFFNLFFDMNMSASFLLLTMTTNNRNKQKMGTQHTKEGKQKSTEDKQKTGLEQNKEENHKEQRRRIEQKNMKI